MTEASAALAVIKEEKGTGALFRQATDVAGVCGEIVKATAQQIGDRKYVKVEGWQSIAVTYGCIASSRDVERVPGGFRAIGEVRRMSDGVVLAVAEGFVGEDEPVWFGGKGKDRNGKEKIYERRAEYAIRAMAQTRAISRACRSAFAFVVTLIDKSLSTTPAEEVPDGGFNDHFASPNSEKATATKQRLATEKTVEGTATSKPASDGPTNFPNYGKRKGEAIAGAKQEDLVFYRKGAERTIADASKSKWHDRERALIDAIDAELRKQSKGTDAPAPDATNGSEPPPPTDADAPQF